MGSSDLVPEAASLVRTFASRLTNVSPSRLHHAHATSRMLISQAPRTFSEVSDSWTDILLVPAFDPLKDD